MAENCRIFHLKLNALRQLKILLNSIIHDGIDCLCKKGYRVKCAVRSVDQEHSLLKGFSVLFSLFLNGAVKY